jgi:uncharacterized cupredoxin-like copper-binding protein
MNSNEGHTMPSSRTRFAVALVAAGLLSIGFSACGGDATTTVTESQTTTFFLPATGSGEPGGGGPVTTGGTTTTTPASPSGGAGGLAFQMGDYFFEPAQTTVAAGSVKVTVTNVGATPHEWVLAKSDLDPASLPTGSSGDVDEDKLDSPGEIADVVPGADDSTTLKLKPGKYVFFCNIPGHYGAGMYGSLDVTG